ncbi:MAG TPA: hypothetical protein ACFCUD_00520 [Cyclobacteriaceae bacterium]
MKTKFNLILFAFLFISFSGVSQSSEIICTAYKQIVKTGGVWGQWPDHWTTYESERRSDPVIRVTTLSEGPQGDFYRLQMFIDGIVQADFNVAYDPEVTTQIRGEWNDQYVNCYADENGDYVYTQVVSLQGLAQDPQLWGDNENALLYLMVYSEDYSVVLK